MQKFCFSRDMIHSLAKHVIWLIMLMYGIVFLLSRSPGDPYDRLIASDGKAYYAYLPAIFIYQDLTYGFVEYYQSKYYPSDSDPAYFKEFRFEYKGETVNKAFAGIAVLMLPFFLLAHFMALLFGQADGYSIIYQYAIGASAYFYLWLALVTLRKLLREYSDNELHISIVLLAIAAGTNLVYYTVAEGTMPHVYLFFLTNLFLLLSYKAIHEHRTGYFVSAGIVFGLILISRPQNGFIVIALPFLAGNMRSLSSAVRTLLTRHTLLKVIVAFSAVLMLQSILWYIQTGHLLVYSYGNERFDFLNPQIVKLLWSYEKGWMIYTPLAFLAVAGMISIAKRSLFQMFFMLATFMVLTYVISCWWVWHYTSQFGQRVFIDFYGLLAILLLAGFTLTKSRYFKHSYTSLILVLTVLNLFQYYQHRIWIYPKGPVTKQTYWGNFFRLQPQTAVTIPYDLVERVYSFEFPVHPDPAPGKAHDIVLQTYSLEPFKFNKLFSIGFGHIAAPETQILKISTSIWGCSATELTMHVAFYSGGKKYSDYTWRMDPILRCNKLNAVEFAVHMPFSFTKQDSACIYVYSTVAESIGIGCAVVQIINLKPHQSARWISRPLNTLESLRTMCFDLESDIDNFRPGQISTEVALSGLRSIKIDSLQAFGAAFTGMADQFFAGENRALQVSFATNSRHNVDDAVLVIAQTTGTKVLSYEELPVRIPDTDGTWLRHRFRHPLPFPAGQGELQVYFWDKQASSPWYMDDLCIDFITLADRRFAPGESLDNATTHKPIIRLTDTVEINSADRFYGLPFIALSGLTDCRQAEITVSASVMTDVWFPGISLVVSHHAKKEMMGYDGRYFSVHTLKNRWRNLTWEFRVDSCHGLHDTLRVYFWNPAPDERVWITDFVLSVPGLVGSTDMK